MLYELFMFNNELDLLEIKLEELHDFVDKFIIVESTHTHTNLPKKLYYAENQKRFEKYKDKIIHLVCTFTETDLYKTQYDKYKKIKQIDDIWFREHFQRDFGIISNQIEFNDEDIIIVTDLDEIVNKKNLSRFIKENGIDKIYRLGMSLHYYNFNLRVPFPILWRHSYIAKYKHLKEFNFAVSYLRHNYKFVTPEYYDILIEDMGWHFTYMMTANHIVEKKYKQFAHAEEVKYMSEQDVTQMMENRQAYDHDLVECPVEELPDTISRLLRLSRYINKLHP